MKPCKICNKPQSGGYIICAECAVEVNRMQAEIQQFREAAAEYGIDAQTMLTLARSQIATAKENAELREAQRWIPVKERLPDDVGSYLVYYHEWSNGDFLPKYDDYRIRVMRFMNNGKWCMPVCTDKRCEADTNREVTHWQKLPQPPQKG